MDLSRSRPLLVGITATIVIAWLVANVMLAARFTLASSDSILYSLPLASADPARPGLGIPFLDDFDGYGSAWGHQWPGSMWLRWPIFRIVPFSRTADTALLLVFQAATAILTARMALLATARLGLALAAGLLVLSDRLLLLTCVGNRFETIAVFCVVVLVTDVCQKGKPRGVAWKILTCAAAFLAPAVHPYGLALGGLILAWDAIQSWREQTGFGRFSMSAGCFAAGCVAGIAWFALQPAALHQFLANLALQKSFYQSANPVWEQLANYRLGGGYALWGAGMLSTIWLTAGAPLPFRQATRLPAVFRFMIPGLAVAVAAIHTITRCENFHYLAFSTPFLAVAVCVAANRVIQGSSKLPAFAAAIALGGLVLLHAAILPYRLLQFARAGFPNLERELVGVLEELPDGRTIYIPHTLWPAALKDHHSIRWWTFPLASPIEARRRYEKGAYAAARPGDFLIVDNGAAASVDKFGLLPTFSMLPPNPAAWEPVKTIQRLIHGATTWGIDLTVYRRKDFK